MCQVYRRAVVHTVSSWRGSNGTVDVCDNGERFYERVIAAMMTRMFTVARRQLTSCSRQLLTSVFVFVVATTSLVVDAASTAAAGPLHLVAVLPAVNFSNWTAAFQEAVSTTVAQDGSALAVPGVAVSAAGGMRLTVGSVCAAVERRNVSAIVVVGDQSIINSLLVVAQHLRVPLLGYNVERRSAVSPVCSDLPRHHRV